MYKLTDILIKDAVKRAIDHYGLEGAIEVVCRVYCYYPRIKSAFLQEINKKFKNK